MNNRTTRNNLGWLGKFLLTALILPLITMTSAVLAQSTIVLVNNSGLDQKDPPDGYVWVTGWVYGATAQIQLLRESGQLSALTEDEKNNGFEAKWFLLDDIIKNAGNGISFPAGNYSGNNRLFFCISNQKEKDGTPKSPTSFTGNTTSYDFPVVFSAYPFFINGEVEYAGPFDWIEFSYDGQWNTTQVDGFGLNLKLTINAASGTVNYGANDTNSREAIGKAWTDFITNEIAKGVPNADAFQYLLFDKPIDQLITFDPTPPVSGIVDPASLTPDGQFFGLCEPYQFVNALYQPDGTPIHPLKTEIKLLNYWDDTLTAFYTEGNWISIFTNGGHYEGECIANWTNPNNSSIEGPAYKLKNPFYGDQYKDSHPSNYQNEYIYYPKPIPAKNANSGFYGVWTVFGNTYNDNLTPAPTGGTLAGVATQVQNQIWMAINRGIAMDGVIPKDEQTPKTQGYTTNQWFPSTGTTDNWFKDSNTCNLYAKFLHYSDISGNTTVPTSMSGFKNSNSFMYHCAAYAYSLDETPPNYQSFSGYYNQPGDTPTSGGTVTVTIGPWGDSTPPPTTFNFTMDNANIEGVATISPSEGHKTTYSAGKTISLTATITNSDYVFEHWLITVGSSATQHTGTGDNNEYSFNITGNTTAQAVFGQNEEVTVTINTSENGTVSISPSSGPYRIGQSVTLTAAPVENYYLSQFNVAVDGTTTHPTMNPYSFKLTADTTIDADFATGGAEVTVTIDSSDYGETKVTYPQTSTYNAGESITFQAYPLKANYKFDSFHITVDNNTTVSTENPHSYKLTDDTTISTKFTEISPVVTLTMAVKPEGAGTTNDAGGSYHVGSIVPLTATPISGYYFKYWQFTVGSSTYTKAGSGDDNKYSLTITGATTATAVFGANETEATVTVTPNDNGTVTVSPSSGPYYVGHSITVTGTANDNYHFTQFQVTVGGDTTVSTDNPFTFNLTGDTTIVVIFTATVKTATLTMAVSPEDAGTVTPTQTVDQGEPVPIEVLSINTGYRFLRWVNEANSVVDDLKAKSTKVTVNGDSTKVTAEFTLDQPDTVSLGSLIELDASELRISEDDFTKKPKIMVNYDNTAVGKTGKVNLRVVTKVNKTTEPSKVYAEWTKKLPLFDKKNFKDKTKPMHELLAANPIQSLVTEKLIVTDKEVTKQPITLDRFLHVVPPSISSVTGKFVTGETFKVIGEYFGANPPDVFLEYSVTNNKGTTEYKLKKCKIIKKDDTGASTLLFKNAKGKEYKSCMKVWDDDTVYTDAPKVVGYSEITVEYPKINDEKMTLTGYLILNNKVGIATTKLP